MRLAVAMGLGVAGLGLGLGLGFSAVGSGAVATAGAAQEKGYPYQEWDGRVIMARLYFEADAGGGFGFRGGEPPWHHDYPQAERNLMSIVREVSFARGFAGHSNVLRVGDPLLHRFPLAWMAEPGLWTPSDDDVRNLREYLLKGGFIIFDDFGGRRRGAGDELDHVLRQMARVLPGLQPLELNGSEPIFHSFFDIDPAALVLHSYRATREGERYIGYFEDNDRNGRQLAILNANNDIGEFMEYSATGFFPVDITNDAYKLGVNYIVYALTH